MDNIERVLGLHQSLRMIYVVDGYEVTLQHEMGYPYAEYVGKGESLITALMDLDSKIPVGTPKEWGRRQAKNYEIKVCFDAEDNTFISGVWDNCLGVWAKHLGSFKQHSEAVAAATDWINKQ